MQVVAEPLLPLRLPCRQIDKDLGADQQAVIVQIVGVPMQVVAEPLLPLRLPWSPD